MQHKANFYGVLSFSLIGSSTKVKESSPPCNLSIAGKKLFGCIPFQRVSALCEIQIALSRIWTQAAVSISYDDNHYTTSASKII